MKKLLLFAAIAATAMTASAESFSDYFKLTCGDQTLANGETVTVSTYYDPILMDYPEVGSVPGYESKFETKAKIQASNITDEAMDIAFVLTCVDNTTDMFKICWEFSNDMGNCGLAQNGIAVSPADLRPIDPENYIILDVEQVGFTQPTPATFKLDLCVMEGGEKLEGTDYTVYVNFTHEKDITMAVDGIMAEDGAVEYYNLLGTRVANPQKGNVYIVRQGKKVSKRLF